MQDEPASPELQQRLPTRELLLAQALDACIIAERHASGSAQALIAQQPAWLRADLQSMMSLVGSLDSAAASAAMSPEFRRVARARLMQQIGANSATEPVALRGPRLSAVPSRNGHYPGSRRRSRWLWRGSAGLLAAALGLTATLTASASALPGEPLYNLKQAQEELSVRLAPDDQARALALLGRADARLDETARLLEQGRTTAALETTQRYGQSVERATSTYVITINDAPEQSPTAGPQALETRLTQQQEQLQTLLQSAPELARADLREALVTTERGRALVADPRPVERALGRADKSAVAAEAVPTTAAEDSPTVVPTRRPAVVPQPAAPVVVADATEEPAADTVVAQHEGTSRGGDSGNASAQNSAPSGAGRLQLPNKPAVTDDQRDGDDGGPNSSPVVARDDGGSSSDRGGDGVGRGGQASGRGSSPSAQVQRPGVTQSTNAGAANSATNANANRTGNGNASSNGNASGSGSSSGNASGNGDEADASRSRGDDQSQPVVAQGRGDDASQANSVAQGRGDDAAQPIVARQPAGSGSARDSGGGSTSDSRQSAGNAGNDRSANTGSAGGSTGGDRNANGGPSNSATSTRTAPSQVASTADRPNIGGRDNNNGDSRATSSAPSAKPTPTPQSSRRGSDSYSDSNSRATPVPAHNTNADPHTGGGGSSSGNGGYGNGIGDNGHGGD